MSSPPGPQPGRDLNPNNLYATSNLTALLCQTDFEYLRSAIKGVRTAGPGWEAALRKGHVHHSIYLQEILELVEDNLSDATTVLVEYLDGSPEVFWYLAWNSRLRDRMSPDVKMMRMRAHSHMIALSFQLQWNALIMYGPTELFGEVMVKALRNLGQFKGEGFKLAVEAVVGSNLPQPYDVFIRMDDVNSLFLLGAMLEGAHHR